MKKIDVEFTDKDIPDGYISGPHYETDKVGAGVPQVIKVPVPNFKGGVDMLPHIQCESAQIAVTADSKNLEVRAVNIFFAGVSGGLFLPLSPGDAIEFANSIREAATEAADIPIDDFAMAEVGTLQQTLDEEEEEDA